MESRNKVGRMLTIQNPYPLLFYMGKETEVRGNNVKKDIGCSIYLYVGKNDLDTDREVKILEKFNISTEDYFNGVIFGKAVIKSTKRISEVDLEQIKQNKPLQYQMGWYEVGRYELRLDGIELLETPIPIKEGGALFIKDFDASQIKDADFKPQSAFL